MNESNQQHLKLLGRAVEQLTYSEEEKSNQPGCTYINFRATPYQSAMIDTMAKVIGKNPMSLLQEDFSKELAGFILYSSKFIPIIKKIIIEKGDSAFSSGAIKVLEERGVIRRNSSKETSSLIKTEPLSKT